jgi:transcriptional regulator with XRE-family HTH domain
VLRRHRAAAGLSQEELAERAGVSAHERLGLERMLAALPWPERRRVSLLLRGAQAQSENPALHRAVDLVLEVASEVWNNAADPGPGETIAGPDARPDARPRG